MNKIDYAKLFPLSAFESWINDKGGGFLCIKSIDMVNVLFAREPYDTKKTILDNLPKKTGVYRRNIAESIWKSDYYKVPERYRKEIAAFIQYCKDLYISIEDKNSLVDNADAREKEQAKTATDKAIEEAVKMGAVFHDSPMTFLTFTNHPRETKQNKKPKKTKNE